MSLKLNTPTSVQIEMTTGCNELCKHCYNSWQVMEETKKATLSILEIDKIIDQLKQSNVFHAVLTGGEPLLNKKGTLHAAAKLYESNIEYSINSNLTLMSGGVAKELESLGIGSILTSLISSDAKTHNFVAQNKRAFENRMRGVNCVLDNTQIPLAVSMVLTKYNQDHVYSTAEFLSKMGIKNFAVTRGSYPLNIPHFDEIAIGQEETVKGLKDLIRAKEDFGLKIIDILECYPLCFLSQDSDFYQFSTHKCTAGVTGVAIGADGMVRACTHSDKSYGNILQENLKDIRDRMDARRNGDLLPNVCKDCGSLGECSGGCRMDALAINNDIKTLDPFAIPEFAKNINKKEKTFELQSLKNKILEIPQSVTIRPEKDGYIIGKGYNFLYVNKDSGDFLKYIQTIGKTKLEDIINEYEIDIDVLDKFMYILYRNCLLHVL